VGPEGYDSGHDSSSPRYVMQSFFLCGVKLC
jgi:hypothetical protein